MVRKSWESPLPQMVAAAEIEQVEADAARPQVLNHCQRLQSVARVLRAVSR
jgi:hypothetical protein